MRFCVFSSNFSVVGFCLAGFHNICFSSTSVPVRINPCLFCYFNSSTFFRIRTLLWASSIRFSTVFNSYLLSAISYSSWPTFSSCNALVARSSFDWTRDATCSRLFNYSMEDKWLGLRWSLGTYLVPVFFERWLCLLKVLEKHVPKQITLINSA